MGLLRPRAFWQAGWRPVHGTSATRHSSRLWPACTSKSQAGQRYYGKVSSPLDNLLQVSPEVREALSHNKPVVALESTIYTHGALGRDLPEVLNNIVRQNGAVPATIGVLDGVPRVGLSPEEIDRMVDEGARKISRRDFAYVVGAVSSLSYSGQYYACRKPNADLISRA